MNSTASALADAPPSLATKVRFLSDPSAYPHAPAAVEIVETHMSFVFLAGERVFKLKKPVRFPFLNFSTLEAREAMCREELRLNRRLTVDIYLDVRPLTALPSGVLTLNGEGAVVEWLVEMRRLPRERMLDRLLIEGRITDSEIAILSQRLVAFYRGADRSTISAEDYEARFFQEQAKNRDILTCRDFALDHGRAHVILDRLDARLNADRALLQERVRSGRIVDGHGDLRPEHVCFADPIAIFDCLEFNRALRQVDPFDELAFLGMECAQLGAPSFGPKLIESVSRQLGDPVSARLTSLYTAWRAVLRARLAVAHLLDPVPRLPEKWEPLAGRYLTLAETALA